MKEAVDGSKHRGIPKTSDFPYKTGNFEDMKGSNTD